jgi:hypothetical protein
MSAPRFLVGICAGWAVAGSAAAQPTVRPPIRPTATVPAVTAPAPKPSPFPWLPDVPAEHRDAVAAIVKQPTLSARFTEDEFIAHPKVYTWLLDHPDRAAAGWLRVGVPSVAIDDLNDGRFRWKDESGSDLTWRTVATYADGRVWYAAGQVKPSALFPMVSVKAVAVLRHPSKPAAGGHETYTPSIEVYFQTDSKAAQAVLRLFGPAAPRMAEDGAEQLLFFFSGLARHLYKHPEKVPSVLAPVKK